MSFKETEMVMQRSRASELVKYLADTLKMHIRIDEEVSGMIVYRLDASEWRIRLSNNTALIDTCPSQRDNISPLDLIDKITDVVIQKRLHDSIFLIVIPGEDEQPKKETYRWRHQSILLDDRDIGEILESGRSFEGIISKIIQQLPLGVLSPYQFGSPVTGSSFFGRSYEINTILAHPRTSFSIIGTRRIGKTSLLFEIRRRLPEEIQSRSFFIDCSQFGSTGEFLSNVIIELAGMHDYYVRRRGELQRAMRGEQDTFFLQRFFGQMEKKYGGSIVLLLDEADQLLQLDANSGYEVFKVLRGSSNAGHIRVLTSGFRYLLDQTFVIGSPLFNFTTPIRLGPLTRNETEQLVISPMRSLRIQMSDARSIANRIYDETGGHPNLVQYYCYMLLEQLDKEGRREVTPSYLDSIREQREFQDYVLEAFRENTTELGKLIVYALADQKEFNLQRIDAVLRRNRVNLTLGEWDSACRELEIAGVLSRQGTTYRFVTPLLPRLVSSLYSREFLVAKTKEHLNR